MTQMAAIGVSGLFKPRVGKCSNNVSRKSVDKQEAMAALSFSFVFLRIILHVRSVINPRPVLLTIISSFLRPSVRLSVNPPPPPSRDPISFSVNHFQFSAGRGCLYFLRSPSASLKEFFDACQLSFQSIAWLNLLRLDRSIDRLIDRSIDLG